MKNTFSLEHRTRTADLNVDFIMRQNELKKIAKFMEMKSLETKLKQSEIAREVNLIIFYITTA